MRIDPRDEVLQILIDSESKVGRTDRVRGGGRWLNRPGARARQWGLEYKLNSFEFGQREETGGPPVKRSCRSRRRGDQRKTIVCHLRRT